MGTLKIRIILFILLVFFANSSYAQNNITISPKAGINFSTLKGMDFISEEYAITRNKTKLFPYFGAEAEFRNYNNSLAIGVSFSKMGCRFYDEYICDVDLIQDYIETSFLYKRYFGEHFSIYSGINLTNILRSKQSGYQYINWEKNDYNRNLINETNRLNFSIPIGISIEYYSFFLGIQYSLGLSNTLKKEIYYKSKPSSLIFVIGKKIHIK